MMDCKRALTATKGDEEAAIDLLRKKGQKVASKRAGREALEGLIIAQVAHDNRVGVLLEVNCETDFVARNSEFDDFAHAVAKLILDALPSDMETLLGLPFRNGRTVGQFLTDLTGKIGEKLAIRRFAVMQSQTGHVVRYVHPGSRLGVLVEMSGNGQIEFTGRDVAMQVAALNPVAGFRSEGPQEVQEKEMEIARETARNEGKPERLLEVIARGKLNRYFKDHVLVEQSFVKDASITVKKLLKQQSVVFHRFIRYQLGA